MRAFNGHITVTKIADGSSEHGKTWDQFVYRSENASFYHLYKWRQFYSDYFRKPTYYFVASDERGDPCGVLPLVHQKSWIFGNYLISLPFMNYGGVLADHADAALRLIETASNLGSELGAAYVEYRHRVPDYDLPVRTDKVAMLLELPKSEEQLSKALGAKVRSQIRRSARENPVTSVESLQLLDGFYEVFSRNMRDLGTPVYARSMFEYILRSFPQQSRIVLITIQNRPAAAAFLLRFGNTMEIPWASAVRDYNPISINMLLYWEVLKYAIGSGCEVFDFGRSSIDSGPYRFKRQWGAQPVQLYWHYWLRKGEEVPKLNPENPKYALAIRAWQKLPLAIANRIGPYLVQNLP